ncbi:MAG: hypothetical protein FJX29_10415 [Alphaproteobacteria bacterium]|nr:hypothetical protein [Alphaproteobacteria bacterium]
MSSKTLEDIYAALAEGIDEAGRERETLFLARAALLMAEKIGDADAVLALIEAVRSQLEGMRRPE